MRSFRLALAVFIGACVVSPAQAAPLEAYGRLPSIEDAVMSPDGNTVALIATDGEQRKVILKKLTGDGAVTGFTVGDAKLRSVMFASPNYLLLTKSNTAAVAGLTGPRREYQMAFVYDLTTGKLRPLLSQVERSMNVFYGEPMVRTVAGRPVVFLQGVNFSSNRGRLALFRVDLETIRAKLIDADTEDANDWAVDADGEILARSEFDGQSGRWQLKMRTPQGMRSVRTLDALNERPNLSGLGRDGGSVLVSQMENGRRTLREIPRGATTWGEPLQAERYSEALRDPAKHTLIGGYSLVGDEPRYTFFDTQDQRVWNAIKAAYPGDQVDLVSWSEDRKKILVKVQSLTEGPAYAVVDLATRRADWLGASYFGITANDISPVKAVRFKAQDGLELSGYLTTPRGGPTKNLPLVVFPHGGPASRDTLEFDWWAQAMASRGYAVLQVNYRGSDGFGWEFLKAGFGQWGRKMQTDLSDGVRHLASQGVIDPKRVCIVGASYGGYAALAGVTLEKDVYRCAASVAGPSDLARMVSWSRRQSGMTAQRYWLRFMGAENVRDETLDVLSPALLADRVQAPVLLIHGRDDTVVPLEQSRFMADALKRSGRNVEFTTLAGDDHWLSRGETRLQMLRSVVDFLEKHNPPT